MLVPMPEKKAILNLRLDPLVRDQFAIAAKLRGASMSGLIHQFIVRTIREEKSDSPQAFAGSIPPPEEMRIAYVRHEGEITDETLTGNVGDRQQLKGKLGDLGNANERNESEVRKPRKRSGK